MRRKERTLMTQALTCEAEDYELEKGAKVVQLVVIPTLLTDLVRVHELDDAVSGRNEGGFGSTGK